MEARLQRALFHEKYTGLNGHNRAPKSDNSHLDKSKFQKAKLYWRPGIARIAEMVAFAIYISHKLLFVLACPKLTRKVQRARRQIINSRDDFTTKIVPAFYLNHFLLKLVTLLRYSSASSTAYKHFATQHFFLLNPQLERFVAVRFAQYPGLSEPY